MYIVIIIDAGVLRENNGFDQVRWTSLQTDTSVIDLL